MDFFIELTYFGEWKVTFVPGTRTYGAHDQHVTWCTSTKDLMRYLNQVLPEVTRAVEEKPPRTR